MSIGAASVSAVPPSEGIVAPVKADELTGNLQDMVLATCLARNEFLNQRTADKVRDLQEKTAAIAQAREALLDLKNNGKMKNGYFYGIAEETFQFLLSHSEALPKGVSLEIGVKLRRCLELEARRNMPGSLSLEEMKELDQLQQWRSRYRRTEHTTQADTLLYCGQFEYHDYEDMAPKIESLIKRETGEAQAKAIGLQAAIRAGEQMLMLAADVTRKGADTYQKILNKTS